MRILNEGVIPQKLRETHSCWFCNCRFEYNKKTERTLSMIRSNGGGKQYDVTCPYCSTPNLLEKPKPETYSEWLGTRMNKRANKSK